MLSLEQVPPIVFLQTAQLPKGILAIQAPRVTIGVNQKVNYVGAAENSVVCGVGHYVDSTPRLQEVMVVKENRDAG
jgi:hypothetical protein